MSGGAARERCWDERKRHTRVSTSHPPLSLDCSIMAKHTKGNKQEKTAEEQTTPSSLPQWFLEKVETTTNVRARRVLEHLVTHGHVTTDEIKTLYGYNHPPRAAQDVKDMGIPLQMTMVSRIGEDGIRKTMAQYRLPEFGMSGEIVIGLGRRAFPKVLKGQLAKLSEPGCRICGAAVPLNHLQIDHRIPYAIAGDASDIRPEDYMLLCGSCNRTKSFTCENCPNWMARDIEVCQTCYWSSPEEYMHIATIQQRRLTLTWTGDEEVARYDAAVSQNPEGDVAKFLKNQL